MFLLPIGHENDTVRRLPWITFGIMAICIVIHAFISLDVNETEKELNKVSRELVSYYFQHPYLELDPEAKKLIFGEADNERIEGMLSLYRQGAHRPGVLSQEEEQEKLDQLSQNFKNLLNDFPYRKWGFIPAKKSLIALLTYMFIHGGFLHLIGNLLFLYLMGPFIEDVWGRPIYLVFYVVMGMLSALMYAQHYPDFVGPLIGASGAIAGVMGAFLIRYWNTKINFFYIIGFFFKGTFQAPAWLMLPLWLLLEIFNARIIDSFNPQGGGGVAHWAHVWGFSFGVVVALGMKALKIEEKHVHSKIEAKIQVGDRVFETVVKAIQKKNAGRTDEAYALLLDEARKNPLRKDVVESLWEFGIEMGKADESTTYFINLIESEIRRNQLDVATNHFLDLRQKNPEASIGPTYKFALMKYLAGRKNIEDARKLAIELLKEIDLNSSPQVLQDFAKITVELDSSVAKDAINLCLQHPEIPPDRKDTLRNELYELQRESQTAPAAGMGQIFPVTEE